MKARGRMKRYLGGGAALLLATALVWATGGVYTQTKHGDSSTGVLRLATEPRGDCSQCHDQHASRDGNPTAGPYPYVLFAPNDNQLCYSAGGAEGCHASAGANSIYQGSTIYDASSHQTSSAVVWPGPTPRARSSGDAGICVNCHTPHGRDDGSGLIPSQLSVREEDSCETCHDSSGPASTDVASDMNKSSRHPSGDHQGRHDAAEGGDSTAFGTTNRHAECEDCHNPHDVRQDTVSPSPPTASNRNQRVSRVAVTNGGAGTQPTYTFRPADDATTVLEYELCFKCHSGWTTQPAGQPDLSVLFNPNNPSYHPVEAQGKNLNILAGAFVNGWAPTDQMYCSDCHRSDDGLVEGPHGSTNPAILSGPVTQYPGTVTASEQCFDCHNYDTYVTGNDSNTRYDRHDSHVDDASCVVCHDPHGAPDPDNPGCVDLANPTDPTCLAMIRIVCDPGNPAPGCTPGEGIISIDFPTPNDSGGCVATCHQFKRYRWVSNYPAR